MEALVNLVRFAGFGQACLGMSKVLQNNKATISIYVALVTHPWKLECYHVVFSWVWSSMPKVL